MTPTHKIRKVVFGENPINGIAFSVDQIFRNGSEITQIIEDTNHFFMFGKKRILIYLKAESKEFLWKAVEGVPVVIEYFSPDGKEVNIL